MRTVQLELLRPGEILEEMRRCSIVYLPIGPLEWHGPAMPLGTDPLYAQGVARAVAQEVGGLVAPTLFFGTERERPKDILAAKGFSAPQPYVLGMDVPANSMPSYYAREDIFSLTVREHLRLFAKQGYKLAVLVNGHGAWGQVDSLKHLAAEFSNETSMAVLYTMPIAPLSPEDDFGHGCLLETAFMMYLHGDCVDLSQFPPRDVPLKYVDYGIADDFVFSCKPSPNNAVVYDPRDATAALGGRYVNAAIEASCKAVREAYAKL